MRFEGLMQHHIPGIALEVVQNPRVLIPTAENKSRISALMNVAPDHGRAHCLPYSHEVFALGLATVVKTTAISWLTVAVGLSATRKVRSSWSTLRPFFSGRANSSFRLQRCPPNLSCNDLVHAFALFFDVSQWSSRPLRVPPSDWNLRVVYRSRNELAHVARNLRAVIGASRQCSPICTDQ